MIMNSRDCSLAEATRNAAASRRANMRSALDAMCLMKLISSSVLSATAR
jgi:hypothetical protein